MARKRKVESEITEYEKERMKRIEENRSRMLALGLPNIVSSLSNPNQNKHKTKKNHDDDDDDDYIPIVEEETDDESEHQQKQDSPSRTPKGKKKSSTSKKKVQVEEHKSNSEFDDEDEAFLQAIALSIQDKMFTQFEGCSSKTPDPRLTNVKSSEKKGKAHIQEESGTMKRKKQVSSRVQMTEDELVVHFFQFDEAGKGYITVKDLEFMAATHDFIWTDKELADMIRCFDSNGDGKKLNIDDFRKIVGRCNMIQSSECY